MSDQKGNLSHKTCDFVFKNVLRGKPENNIYLEHRAMPFKESERKKLYEKESGTIFDDNYKKTNNDQKINSRYGNKYYNGHLKTNIKFETPQAKSNLNELNASRNFSGVNQNLNKMNKSFNLPDSDRQTTSNPLSQSLILSENKSRRIKDTYLCNPIEILSKQEFQNFKNQENKVMEAKTKRVSKIFSSQHIKNTVQNDPKTPITTQSKITNNDFNIFKEVGKDFKPAGKKQFKHVVENGRVFYY